MQASEVQASTTGVDDLRSLHSLVLRARQHMALHASIDRFAFVAGANLAKLLLLLSTHELQLRFSPAHGVPQSCCLSA